MSKPSPEYQRQWREANPDKIAAYRQKDYHSKRETRQEYYRRNREEIRAKNKAYYEEHKEEINARKRARYAENPERFLEAQRRWKRKGGRDYMTKEQRAAYNKAYNQRPEVRERRRKLRAEYRTSSEKWNNERRGKFARIMQKHGLDLPKKNMAQNSVQE